MQVARKRAGQPRDVAPRLENRHVGSATTPVRKGNSLHRYEIIRPVVRQRRLHYDGGADGSAVGEVRRPLELIRRQRVPVQAKLLEDGLCTKLGFPNTPEHGETVVDEPPTMPGSKDTGPNPMDVCLVLWRQPGSRTRRLLP